MAKKDTETSKYNLFDVIQNKNKTIDTKKDVGFYNKTSKASVVYKGDGSTTNANGFYAQYKNDQESGVATELSLQSNTITVQKDIVAKDIAINFHKLNSQLYELTNMKQVMGTAIGNLTMMGTVLVKTWEPSLKKWVLIRRQVRIPVFSNILDPYAIDENIGLDLDEAYDSIADYKISKDSSRK